MVRDGFRIEFAPTLLLAALSALSGAVMAGLLVWSLRGSVAAAVEPPPPPQDSVAEIVEAAARGCADSGGTFWVGQEAGVTVARCRPWLELAPGPAVRRASR